MSLQDKLDAFKAEFEGKKAPPEVVAVFHRSTAELIASGQAARALNVGDRAPAFRLPDSGRATVTSAELLAKGPLVVTFYRGAWCPYCNMDLQAIEAAASQIRSLGASLVAISPQTPASSSKSQRDNALSFPILSDHGGEIAAAFGLRWRVEEELKAVMTAFKVDLAVFNSEPSWTLPTGARPISTSTR